MSCPRIALPIAVPLFGFVCASMGCAVGVPVNTLESEPAAATQAGQSAPPPPGAGNGAAIPQATAGSGLGGPPMATAGQGAARPPSQDPSTAGRGAAGGSSARAGSGGSSVPPVAGRGAAGSAATSPGTLPPANPPVVADLCGGAGLSAGNQTVSFSFAGAQRSYIVHVPPGIKAGSPQALLVVMHDWSQTSAAAQTVFGLDGTADAKSFLAVYPQGNKEAWNAGSCCGSNTEDSVAFIRAVVADLTAKTCVDCRRIYATGMSNGGMMAYRLACEATDLFAAVAPVAADLRLAHCTPSQPVAVIAVNGTADTSVPYRGAALSVANLRRTLECNATPTIERFGLDRCDRYSSCTGGVEVTHCTDTGGAHVWSSALGFDTNTLIWNFLHRFRLPD